MIKQIILTRFNVGVFSEKVVYWGKREFGTLDPSLWTAKRLALMERVVVPTLLKQTDQDFEWVILADSATPQPLLDELRRITTPVGCEMILTDEGYSDVLGEKNDGYGLVELLNSLGTGCDFIITTQLDSDTGISPNYVQRCKENYNHYDTYPFAIDPLIQASVVYDPETDTVYPRIWNVSAHITATLSVIDRAGKPDLATTLNILHLDVLELMKVVKVRDISLFTLTHDINVVGRNRPPIPDKMKRRVCEITFLRENLKYFGIEFDIAASWVDDIPNIVELV